MMPDIAPAIVSDSEADSVSSADETHSTNNNMFNKRTENKIKEDVTLETLYEDDNTDLLSNSQLGPDSPSQYPQAQELNKPKHRLSRQRSRSQLEIISPSASSPRIYDFVEEVSPLRQGKDQMFKPDNFNVWAYFRREMFGIGEPGHLDHDAVDSIQNFLAIPSRLEFLLSFGFVISFDAFLFVITYLPVRGVFAIWLLIYDIITNIYRRYIKPDVRSKRRKTIGVYFHRNNLYDLLRFSLMLIGCFFLQTLDMSRVYHFIRGQTMIKLYVLTTMMEMLDKLFATFGQDMFGSLYWQTRTNPDHIGSLLKLIFVASIYIALHSSIFFFNVATLAVAVNSSDRSLLTVLILNNVSEIKTYVFKKFDRINLFQLSCSDITERFHIGLFLFCISIGGIAQSGPNWFEAVKSHLVICAMFFTAEMIADSVKHAFIAKFNDIQPTIYEEFAIVLRNDILNSHKEMVILDQTYAIARRLGLSQIPLGCVFVRYMIMALMSPYWLEQIKSSSWGVCIFVCAVIFLLLLIVKTAVGIGLVLYCGNLHNLDLRQRLVDQSFGDKASAITSIDPDDSLAEIGRYTAVEGRIVG